MNVIFGVNDDGIEDGDNDGDDVDWRMDVNDMVVSETIGVC